MKKYKWWIYTVLIGLLPFFARIFIYSIAYKIDSIYILNEIDMVAFGLVMVTNNINELEGNNRFDSEFKSICIGFSTLLLLCMAIILGIAYVMDAVPISQLSRTNIKYCSLGLSLISFIFSLSIIYKPVYNADSA